MSQGPEEIRRPVRRAGRPPAQPSDLPPASSPASSTEGPFGYAPEVPPGGYPSEAAAVGGLTARTMALAGSSLIVLLAVVLLFAGALPGGDGATSALRGGDKETVNPPNAGTGGGSECVAATKDLLCQAKAQANSTQVTGTDVQIKPDGPGSVTLGDPRQMIDGRPETVWATAGEATGLEITLQFKYPVTVATVGLATATSGQSSGRRVLAATWSFAAAPATSTGFCPIVLGEFESPVRQDFSAAPGTTPVTPPVQACAVRVRLDELSRVTGSGGGAIAISELTLLAPQ